MIPFDLVVSGFSIHYLEDNAKIKVYNDVFEILKPGGLFFNLESKISRYIADASYWIYLIHLPLLFFIQFKLLDVDWNLWIKFMVSSLGTMAIGLITYMIMVRWTPIGSLLNGKKKPILS